MVHQELKERGEDLVEMEKEVYLGLLDQKVSQDSKACLVWQDQKETEATKEMLARREMMGHLVCLEMMVLLVCQVFLEKWDQGVFLVREDLMDCQVLLEFQDLKELQGQREMKDQLGHQV